MKAHEYIISVLGRVTLYSLAMFLSMLFSRMAMHGTYTSHLSMFIVLSVAIELFWSRSRDGYVRTWVYLACVAGVVISGAALVRQAESLVRTEQQLRIQSGRINEIVSNMPSAVFAVDETGIVCAANDGILSMTGYSSEELVGQSVAVLFPNADCDSRLNQYRQDVQQMRRLTDKGWIVRRDPNLRLKHRDGHPLLVEASMFALRHAVGDETRNDIHFVTIVAVHGGK